MKLSTFALAATGAAIVKAEDKLQAIPIAVTTSSHDHAAMLATTGATGVVNGVPGANTSPLAPVVTSFVTTTLPCTSNSSSFLTLVHPIVLEDPSTVISTITTTCDCSSSAASIPLVTSIPVVASSSAPSITSSVATIGVPAVASSSNRTSTVTNTTTNVRTQTVTLKNSSSSTTAHPVATGVPLVVSAPHSVSNGTSSTIGHPGFGSGTGRPSGTMPSATYTPGSSLLPLSNGAAGVGGANFAMVAFAVACLFMGGRFD